MQKTAQKTKVFFVITKSNFGGAQKYIYDLAVRLPSSEFDVAVVTGGEGMLAEKLHLVGIRVITIPSLARDIDPLKDILSLVTLVRLFKTEHPDVVHLNSAKASGIGALAGRLTHVPKIIFTAHGWAFNEDRSRFSRILIKTFSWTTVMLAHKTIAVSDAIFHDMQWLGARKKMVVIKNGIGAIDFLPTALARTRLAKLASVEFPSNASFVGTIAELHKNKGLSYAIEAFAELAPKHPSLYYFILGDGEEKERLNTLVEHYGLRGRVFLAGFIEDASNYLKGFDVFILPSIKEGLPYVLLEAGLAELPVVATTVGGIPEIVEDMRTGLLVPPRDPGAIARALSWVISNPEQSVKLGTKLLTKVNKDFSLGRVIAETIALYTKK